VEPPIQAAPPAANPIINHVLSLIGNRISRSETVARKSWPEDPIQGRLWASIDGFIDSDGMGN
jgi:hypothetical protein